MTIRVTQKFTCDHPEPTAEQKEKGKVKVKDGYPPVKVTTQGFSFVSETRHCLCTGKALPMKRDIIHKDPDTGPT